MIAQFFNERLPSVWTRLFVAVFAIVAIVWVVLGVAIVFFNQVSRDYAELANVHIPRIALASELAENSARLARITTAIVGQQGSGGEEKIKTDLEEVIVAITQQIERTGLVETQNSEGGESYGGPTQEGFGELLRNVLAGLEKRLELTSQIANEMGGLRWLNVDIQDEVDPLLNDFAFNLTVATDAMARSADPDFRFQLGERLGVERAARDAIRQVGGEAANLLTLMLQSSVAADMAQLNQFKNLADDNLTRLNLTSENLPEGAEFLTLKQSVLALTELAQDPENVFQLRTQWLQTQTGLLEMLNLVQENLEGLQSTLAGIGAEQRASVLAVTGASAGRANLAVWWLVGLTFLAGIVGAIALFGYVRRGIVLPLGDMSSAMLAIADGKEVTSLPQVGEDEIGQMSRAVGVFQKSAQARDSALKQLNTEVGERRRAVEDLKRTQAELVQAGKLAALGQLSSGISHELNQPLAAMKHRIHLLRTGVAEKSDEKVQRQIERMDGLVARMEATITHLKRFARRSEYKSENIKLGSIIDQSVLLLKGRIDGPAIDFKVDKDICDVLVQGDQILIEQVVVNLLSNSLDAIAQTKNGGSIHLSGKEDGENFALQNFTLIVADNGIGLGDMKPETAFEPFVTSKEVGEGLGLGLSISYNIVKGMGGDLALEENHPKGTKALLSLPFGENND